METEKDKSDWWLGILCRDWMATMCDWDVAYITQNVQIAEVIPSPNHAEVEPYVDSLNAMMKIFWWDIAVLIENYKWCTFSMPYLPYWWGYIHSSKINILFNSQENLKKYMKIHITREVQEYLIFDCRSNGSWEIHWKNLVFLFVGLFPINHWTDNQN